MVDVCMHRWRGQGWVGLCTLGPSDHPTDEVTITVVVFPHKQCETEASAGIQGDGVSLSYNTLDCAVIDGLSELNCGVVPSHM